MRIASVANSADGQQLRSRTAKLHASKQSRKRELIWTKDELPAYLNMRARLPFSSFARIIEFERTSVFSPKSGYGTVGTA